MCRSSSGAYLSGRRRAPASRHTNQWGCWLRLVGQYVTWCSMLLSVRWVWDKTRWPTRKNYKINDYLPPPLAGHQHHRCSQASGNFFFLYLRGTSGKQTCNMSLTVPTHLSAHSFFILRWEATHLYLLWIATLFFSFLINLRHIYRHIPSYCMDSRSCLCVMIQCHTNACIYDLLVRFA